LTTNHYYFKNQGFPQTAAENSNFQTLKKGQKSETPPYQNYHQFIADRSWKFSVEKEGHSAEQPLPDVSHL